MGQVVVDKRAFTKISAEDQAIVLEVMETVMNKLNELNRRDDAQARLALQNQGIQFLSVNAQELHRWEDIAERSIKALGEKGVYTQRMYGLLSLYIKEFRDRNPAPGGSNP